jgi:excisionase family DNA binding protein
MDTSKALTVKEVARYTGMTDANVTYHIKVKNLPATRFGYQFVIQQKDFAAFLQSRAQGKFVQGWHKKKVRVQP